MLIAVLGAATVCRGQATRPTDAPPASAPAQGRDQAEIRREADLKVLTEFLDHVNASPEIGEPARTAVRQLWDARRPDEEPRAFMTAAMAMLSPAYRTALDLVEAGKPAEAVPPLQPLLDHRDRYLSVHAAALTARAMVEDDRTEEAQKLLDASLRERGEEISARTFLGPEMTFLLGYCQLANLQYPEAIETLGRLDRAYPDGPDQYLLPARQMLKELKARRPESLGDVSDLMGYAGRQLKHARVSGGVRARQDRAVELLTRLIDDAEQREKQQQQQQTCKQCGGKGCPRCQGSGKAQGNAQQPQRGAERSVAPPGQGRVGEMHQSSRARPGEEWGRMRPEDRERVLQSLRQSFPSRYRQLVEQYYRQLAKEE
jgi:tetratricopeptide (TPR) repeat protein